MMTDDMVHLRDEILAMRKVRGSLMSDLQKDTKSRKKAITHLCSHFGHARAKMAKQTKHERLTFMDNLKHSVGALRKEMTDDLVGARKAWAGKN
jgi:nucleoid-associated protein YejK